MFILYWIFFSLCFCSSNQLELDFKKTQVRAGIQYFQLIEGNKIYQELCDVFRENNLAWIEKSIEKLIKHLYITISEKTMEKDWKRFQIKYYHSSVTKKGGVTFLMQINPFGENNSVLFKKIIAKNIPNMKKGAFSLMYLQTIMLSYGYFWIKSRFDRFHEMLHLDSKHRRHRIENLQNWTDVAKQFILNLKNQIHIKDLFFLQMQRDFQIDLKKDFENKMIEAIYETEELSDIDVSQYEKFDLLSSQFQKNKKSNNSTKLNSHVSDSKLFYFDGKKSENKIHFSSNKSEERQHNYPYLPKNLALSKVNIQDMVHIFLTNRPKYTNILEENFETKLDSYITDTNFNHKQETLDLKTKQNNYAYANQKLSDYSDDRSDSTHSSEEKHFYNNKKNAYSKNVYQTSNFPYYYQNSPNYYNTQNFQNRDHKQPPYDYYQNNQHNPNYNYYHNYKYENYYSYNYYQ